MEVQLNEFISIVTLFSVTITTLLWVVHHKKPKWLVLLISIILSVYSLLMIGILVKDLSLQMELSNYDLDNNGIFESNEQNEVQQKLWQEYINDTKINFSPFFMIVPSILFGLVLFGFIYVASKLFNRP